MALTQVKTSGIADDAVTLAKQAAGTDGQIITYDASGNPTAVGPGTDGQVLTSTGAGSPPAFEALPATGIASLVADTSPQLGGDLDTNSFEISLDDSHKVKFGDGNDFQIEFDGTNTGMIATAGEVYVKAGSNVNLRVQGDEKAIQCVGNGAVELYHDNTKQCETSANGLAFPSGKGIDFSATSDGAGTDSSELLDDYEEGSWTPAIQDLDNTPTYYNLVGKYTKIGNIVKAQGFIQIGGTKASFANTDHVFKVAGLPYAVSGVGYSAAIGNCNWQGFDWVGSSLSTYGDDDDTQLTAGIVSSTVNTFRTMGQREYYMGEVKNVAMDNKGFILEWDITYFTAT